jgi:hypothetical protein
MQDRCTLDDHDEITAHDGTMTTITKEEMTGGLEMICENRLGRDSGWYCDHRNEDCGRRSSYTDNLNLE